MIEIKELTKNEDGQCKIIIHKGYKFDEFTSYYHNKSSWVFIDNLSGLQIVNFKTTKENALKLFEDESLQLKLKSARNTPRYKQLSYNFNLNVEKIKSYLDKDDE